MRKAVSSCPTFSSDAATRAGSEKAKSLIDSLQPQPYENNYGLHTASILLQISIGCRMSTHTNEFRRYDDEVIFLLNNPRICNTL